MRDLFRLVYCTQNTREPNAGKNDSRLFSSRIVITPMVYCLLAHNVLPFLVSFHIFFCFLFRISWKKKLEERKTTTTFDNIVSKLWSQFYYFILSIISFILPLLKIQATSDHITKLESCFWLHHKIRFSSFFFSFSFFFIRFRATHNKRTNKLKLQGKKSRIICKQTEKLDTQCDNDKKRGFFSEKKN